MKIKLLITVEGGNIQNICMNSAWDIDVYVTDNDNPSCGKYKTQIMTEQGFERQLLEDAVEVSGQGGDVDDNLLIAQP